MNREQMIAWLTLEGWEPVIVSDSRYMRHPATRRFFAVGAYRISPHIYSENATVGVTRQADWASWPDVMLHHIVAGVQQ